MRRDPIEVEATDRLELAEASRKVKRELEATVLEFACFRRMAISGRRSLRLARREDTIDVRISLPKASDLRAKSVARDRTACKAWLERHILSAPQKPFATKAEFRSAALAYWKDLPARQFDFGWDEVTNRAPAWRKQGRLRSDARRPVPSPP